MDNNLLHEKLQSNTHDSFLPTQQQTESFLIDIMVYLQKWGFIICVITVITLTLFALIAKMRKNPKLLRVFKFFGYGVSIIGIGLAFLPYLVLDNLANENDPISLTLPTDIQSENKLNSVLYYLRRWEVWICMTIVGISLLYVGTAKIRKNLRLQRIYMYFTYGAVIIGTLLFYLPSFIINRLIK